MSLSAAIAGARVERVRCKTCIALPRLTAQDRLDFDVEVAARTPASEIAVGLNVRLAEENVCDGSGPMTIGESSVRTHIRAGHRVAV